MKEITIKNLAEIKALEMNVWAWVFNLKPGVDWDKSSANFVELPPLAQWFSYHYHDAKEEIFYIISGTGVIKTVSGEIRVKAWDLMHFTAGKAWTHVIKNTSENEKLVYIDFGTKPETDVAHLLDIDSVLITWKEINGMFKAV